MSIDVVMPQLGESVVEGTLTKWLVKEGDIVTPGQTLASVATDKADSDLPAPAGGRVLQLVAAEGETLKVGAPLAKLEEGNFAAAPAPKADRERRDVQHRDERVRRRDLREGHRLRRLPDLLAVEEMRAARRHDVRDEGALTPFAAAAGPT